MSKEIEPERKYGFSSGTRTVSLEPAKPKSDEEKRQEELKLLRSFKSSILETKVIPNHRQTIRSINETGKVTPRGSFLSEESKSKWLEEAQQTIDLAVQVLGERGDL